MAAASDCDIAIVGGGPAGLMLGFLLARAGIRVIVLEKHADFLRDFRGDTIHASTLDLMHELGLLEAFLTLPHQRITRLEAAFGKDKMVLGDTSRLPARCKFVAIMPQWDFLDFTASQGRRYPGFDLRMSCKAQSLLFDDRERVCGVQTRWADGSTPEDIRANLVVACDGRHSALRDQMIGRGDLEKIERGAAIDALWFRLPRQAQDPSSVGLCVAAGRALIMIARGDYFQCGYIIAKDSLPALQAKGIGALQDGIAALAPFMAGRVAALTDWEAVKLLTVQVNRLQKWHRPGLLCIGDAAHAMSPVGGVGVNLAIQDAVAAANLLYRGISAGEDLDTVAARVQERREWPTKLIQAGQVAVQNTLAERYLSLPAEMAGPIRAPLPLRLVDAVPTLQRLLARLVAVGPRPEHVATPDCRAAF